MYVKYETTLEEIRKEIDKIEKELNWNARLSKEDREVLHDELDYLYSFLPREDY